MKVYILYSIHNQNGESGLLRIFKNRESAETLSAKWKDADPNRYFTVSEHEVVD